MAVPLRQLDDRQLSAIREGARQEAASRRNSRITMERERRRPQLEVVPRARRRVRLAGVGFTALFVVMLGLTVFQTQLARQQWEIDRIEQGVEVERLRLTELRKANAVLHSPERVITEAEKMGLSRGNPDSYMPVSQAAVDQVARAAGDLLLDDEIDTLDNPLAEHKQVKSVLAGETP
jgi:cell division protein FtsL